MVFKIYSFAFYYLNLEINSPDIFKKYASEILSHLKDAKLIVVEGTLYPLLTRLRSANFLTYQWEESKTGPPRKYYSLTKEGKHFLSELASSWNELQIAVEQITNPKK